MSSAARYIPDASCPIPGLGAILEKSFGLTTGTFVEVGAFDGHTCSNTAFLADAGWRGLYIEPVPQFAEACARRHRQNPNVQVANCAIGESEQLIEVHVGGVLTTADPMMAEAYRRIDWARPLHQGQKSQVQQFPLTKVLAATGIAPGFELLVVDVEGGEEGVFNSFSISEWRPHMMIVEIEDRHPSFQQFPAITARAQALRARIHSAGYEEIFRDEINTIFLDGNAKPRT